MNIEPIAFFRSPFSTKFGIPRQSGLVRGFEGEIVFVSTWRQVEAVRGLEHFDYLWLIWEFSMNRGEHRGTTVRPPRLGGNERIGVFATRSPFRPNHLGLSCVRILEVVTEGKEAPLIRVEGADLADGTPIYDIKPYVAYADSRPEARSGFVDERVWHRLQVVVPDELRSCFKTDVWERLEEVLALDPRPPYHQDASRIYGMPFAGCDVRFRVVDEVLTVTSVSDLSTGKNHRK